jgi:hypothetical protein
MADFLEFKRGDFFSDGSLLISLKPEFNIFQKSVCGKEKLHWPFRAGSFEIMT